MLNDSVFNPRRKSKANIGHLYLDLIEYEWPPDSEKFYILQEHLGRFLNIKAFHRKYTNFNIRNVEIMEKQYLLENGLISQVESNFRFIALNYIQVMKFLKENFIENYHQYLVGTHRREYAQLSRDIQRFKNFPKIHQEELYKQAIIDSVRFNSKISDERKSRYYSINMQSFTLMWPQAPPSPKMKYVCDLDQHPLALHPDQYKTNYRKFSSFELSHIFPAEMETVAASVEEIENIEKPKRKRGRKPRQKMTVVDDPLELIQVPRIEENKEIDGGKNIQESIKHACAECKTGDGDDTAHVLTCSGCRKTYHPICMDVSMRYLARVAGYDWKCYYCKKCNVCDNEKNDSTLLLCDTCDRSYHAECLEMAEIPLGRWVCSQCGICASCLRVRQPGTGWVEEFEQTGDSSKLIQVHCQRCSKKFRNKLYCPVCMEVHWKEDIKNILPTCRQCNMIIHLECMNPDSDSCLICSGLVQKRF